jgi:Transport and Golgi organisation 2
MCTVSWFWTAEGYELFANRDESRQRPKALPPRRFEAEGGSYLAPVDTEAGGSWISVNEHGVAVTLLNYYQGASLPVASDWTSRGLLVAALAPSPRAEAVAERLRATALARYRPFTLLALEPGRAAGWRWDGERLLDLGSPPPMPLVSSGVDVDGATRWRTETLVVLEQEAPGSRSVLHRRFHASHRPEAGPFSVCMHRHDAETVSFSWIRVERGSVRFDYAPGAPCTTPVGVGLELPLRRWNGEVPA